MSAAFGPIGGEAACGAVDFSETFRPSTYCRTYNLQTNKAIGKMPGKRVHGRAFANSHSEPVLAGSAGISLRKPLLGASTLQMMPLPSQDACTLPWRPMMRKRERVVLPSLERCKSAGVGRVHVNVDLQPLTRCQVNIDKVAHTAAPMPDTRKLAPTTAMEEDLELTRDSTIRSSKAITVDIPVASDVLASKHRRKRTSTTKRASTSLAVLPLSQAERAVHAQMDSPGEVFDIPAELQKRRTPPGELLWDLHSDTEVENLIDEPDDDYECLEEDIFDCDAEEHAALYVADALLDAEVKDLLCEGGADASIAVEMVEV